MKEVMSAPLDQELSCSINVEQSHKYKFQSHRKLFRFGVKR